MTTFTAWKFETPDGAQKAVTALKGAQGDGLVKIVDHAVISWPVSADKPEMHHSHDDKLRGTGWGAFWGLLFGGLFFVPLLGVAVGAAAGAITKAVSGRHPGEPARRDPRADHRRDVAAVRGDGERRHGPAG